MTAEWNGTQRELEILELRKEIERLQDAKRRALAVADERSKENVRLRKALEEIIRIYTHETGRERMSAANKIAIEVLAGAVAVPPAERAPTE